MADPEILTENSAPVEEPLFAGLKKKSKKAKVNFDENAFLDSLDKDSAVTSNDVATKTVEAAAEKVDEKETAAVEKDDAGGEDDGLGMFGDLKKKKKKKKDISLDLDELEAEPSPAAGQEDQGANDAGADMSEFGDLKKKKKKKKAAFDLEAFEKEIGEAEAGDRAGDDGAENDEEPHIDGELGEDVFGGAAAGVDGEEDKEKKMEESWQGTDRDYTYPELLSRFYHLLHSHNPELAGDKKKLTLVPPSVQREGTKKTMFANLSDICKRMRRNPKHVMEFLFAELGTTGNVDGSGRLVLKGRYTQKSMETVLRRYIVEYVVCRTCKSPDTLLDKENRLYFITCESCGSRRSVATIKTGFQAQIGKRKQMAA